MAGPLVENLETERCWCDLPPELLSLILSRLLLVQDRCSFKAVCKSWNLITSVRIPLSLPPSVDSPFYDSPCLMIPQRSNNNSWKIFHSVYNDFYYLDFPELKDAEIRFSKYGWLLMSREDNTLFFFNPFTKVKMEVPPTTSSFVSVCFSSPPTCSDCIVFGIHSTSTISSTHLGLIFFGGGLVEWHECRYKNFYGSYLSSCPPLYCNGVFHCLDKSGNISVYNPYAISGAYTQYDKCHMGKFGKSGKDLHQCYMADVEGEIWGVFIMCGRGFFMNKLDLEGMDWGPLESLGNKCLYVGPYGSSFAEASGIGLGGMANTIYFNKFHGKSGVVFSMSSGKYYSVDGEYASVDSYGLIDTGYNSTWIKPMYQDGSSKS